ncbi:ROK family protein [Herbiconiux sp. P16]|uniref:ROK family protein n=1 Tax=Herbiconiux wuyangfengii TaxID=3342794 RepID=UPI0035B780C6
MTDAVDLLRTASPAAVDVFTRLLTRGPLSRTDVARLTGLSQAAITKAVAPMIAAGLVADQHDSAVGSGNGNGLPGRPASPVRVVPESLITLGIKVNPGDIIGVATDVTAGILVTAHLAVVDTGFASMVDAIAEVARRLTELLGDRAERLAGICVAVSGDVDTHNGVVRESALLGWADEPLGAALRSRLGVEVLIENDVRALTIAEHWFGVGVGTGSFAIVTIGSGIGCGLHVNGEVVEGAFGVAGEIGHLPLTSEQYVCTCGRRGCVEAVAGSSAIVRAVASAQPTPVATIDDAVALAHAGEPAAVEAFDRAGTVIGTAIATVANLTGPEIVVITGEAVADYDLYDQRLRAAFGAHAFGAAGNCRIVIRPHTFEDWARGAAAAALRALVLQRYVGISTGGFGYRPATSRDALASG